MSIAFSRTTAEISAIRPVATTSAIRPVLDEAMEDFTSSLTLRVSYFSGDEDTLRTMATQAYYNTPQCAFGMPEVDVALYPASGAQRIVELSFRWTGDKKSLGMRSEELLATARRILEENPLAGLGEPVSELAETFRQLTLPADPTGSDDPYSALTGSPATRLARTLALSLLCQESGLETIFVSGFFGGADTCWLIAAVPGGYRHLLLTDEAVLFLSDEEMTALGYLWVSDLYPVCIAPALEPVEPAAASSDEGRDLS